MDISSNSPVKECCAVLHYTVLNYIVLCCAVLFYAVLQYIVMYLLAAKREAKIGSVDSIIETSVAGTCNKTWRTKKEDEILG
jgi:hypothetical protein